MNSEVFLQLRKELNAGLFIFEAENELRKRFENTASNFDLEYKHEGYSLKMSLVDCLALFRELDSRQSIWKFRFQIAPNDKESLEEFAKFRNNFTGINSLFNVDEFSSEQIQEILVKKGFDKRLLTKFQLRDLVELLRMPHGANFSVPGAGKTTVAFALNILLMSQEDKTLVICPKSAFEAWNDVIEDCMKSPQPDDYFIQLEGSPNEIRAQLQSESKRFYINYESAVNNSELLRAFMLKFPVHFIIDESHRIKAGYGSSRGQVCLQLSPLAKRRDILSGTPMPQSPTDIAAQVEFLLPATGDAGRIRSGSNPQTVMQGKFVRTRKNELGLPPKRIIPVEVKMKEPQLAFYSAISDDVIGQFAANSANPNQQRQVVRRNSIRLLQASVFPQLVRDVPLGQPLLLAQAMESGPSAKMEKAVEICRLNAEKGMKTVVWSIFSGTILKLQSMMIDLNAEVFFGGNYDNRFGENYDREISLGRFKKSESSMVLVANPAAGSEGLSLHQVCHHAIYVDRTYNAAHYLQSIDRIHRLGLSADIETYIHVLRSKTPIGIPNIDMSVWRRLSRKVDDLERLLSDPDLHEIVEAEEDDQISIDASMDRDDVLDLIQEMSNLSEQQIK